MKLSFLVLSFAVLSSMSDAGAPQRVASVGGASGAHTPASKSAPKPVKPNAQATSGAHGAQASSQGGTAALVLPPPPHDLCTGALPVSGFGTFTVTTLGATGTGVSGVCSSAEDDVWYAWVAPANGAVEVSTCGLSGADTVIAVWADCPETTLIACNDDNCTTQSRVQFPVTGGTTYFLQFGEFNSGSQYVGQFRILALGTPPANDECTGATPISGFGSFPVDTTNALGMVDSFTCAPPRNDVWFAWTAPSSGPVEVATCSITTDTVVAVWADCPPTTLVACNDDACNTQSQVQFNATSGVTYYFELGAFHAATSFAGAFDVNVGPPPPFPGSVYCTGDGADPLVTTFCPCGNFGALGNGCASSFNAAGAHLDAHGVVANDDVVLDGSGMNASGVCIFLKGDADAPSGVVFGDGVRCVDGALIRLRAVTLASGAASFPDATETITLSARGQTPVGSGVTGYYAVYYRNAAAAFCPPDTFNVSNGYRIDW